LQALPRFGFSPDSAPRYRIRKASRPNFYSTLEAIAATLEGVESGSDYSPLLEAMDAVVESQLEFRRAGKSNSKTKREI
jgi:DTW domain-containing protein YfiP